MKLTKKQISRGLVVIMLLLTSFAGVMANAENGWLDWTGADELADAEAIITELISNINTLDLDLQNVENELLTIESTVDDWLGDALLLDSDSDGFLDIDLNSDGEATIYEKLAYLEAAGTSSAGGLQELQLQVAALEAELIEINLALDNIISTESITVTGTETTLEKIVLIENYIQDQNVELEWLRLELETANTNAEEFKENICSELDNLPTGIRSNYEEWCPTP